MHACEKKDELNRDECPSFFPQNVSLLFRHTSKKNLRHRPVALKHYTESSNVRKFVLGEL